ncbi:hypothetical protein DUI87_06601 [Hirundo rustica rustica]|uniref:Uncharacterized protein n=1 Tax=Hirundo rustica rustica TaxID=333673 RepID=A0A3M0KTM2_HIRRU|nr:hypothetical protein DUI87_06601 [Hirundo rustica rustica]
MHMGMLVIEKLNMTQESALAARKANPGCIQGNVARRLEEGILPLSSTAEFKVLSGKIKDDHGLSGKLLFLQSEYPIKPRTLPLLSLFIFISLHLHLSSSSPPPQPGVVDSQENRWILKLINKDLSRLSPLPVVLTSSLDMIITVATRHNKWWRMRATSEGNRTGTLSVTPAGPP